MRNAPTNRAIPANTSRKVWKKPKNPFTSSACCWALSAPVSASTSAGSTCATLLRSWSGSTSFVAASRTLNSSPGSANSSSARPCSKAVMLAPPRLSFSPNPNTPESTKTSWPSGSSTGTRSPTT